MFLRQRNKVADFRNVGSKLVMSELSNIAVTDATVRCEHVSKSVVVHFPDPVTLFTLILPSGKCQLSVNYANG